MLVIASVKLPVDVSEMSELLVHDPHSYSSEDDALSEWQSMHLLIPIHLKKACNKYFRSEEISIVREFCKINIFPLRIEYPRKLKKDSKIAGCSSHSGLPVFMNVLTKYFLCELVGLVIMKNRTL